MWPIATFPAADLIGLDLWCHHSPRVACKTASQVRTSCSYLHVHTHHEVTQINGGKPNALQCIHSAPTFYTGLYIFISYVICGLWLVQAHSAAASGAVISVHSDLLHRLIHIHSLHYVWLVIGRPEWFMYIVWFLACMIVRARAL